MAEFFNETAYKRLPVAIKSLPEKERDTFIFLRMRRSESYIAGHLEISISDARAIIKRVQEALIKSGTLDLIQDPVFYQIDHPRADENGQSRPFELPQHEMDVADQIELDRFYQVLQDSLQQLPKPSRRLLELWFNKEMRAKDILNFYKRLGLKVKEDKPIEECAEQDIFYALEKNIRNLLVIVRSNLSQGEIELTHSSLKAILNETGV